LEVIVETECVPPEEPPVIENTALPLEFLNTQGVKDPRVISTLAMNTIIMKVIHTNNINIAIGSQIQD
jgi:hypothetical protein